MPIGYSYIRFGSRKQEKGNTIARQVVLWEDRVDDFLKLSA